MSLPAPVRLVVLASGTGSNLQALLDAESDPEHPARVVAVGADRHGTRALERAATAGRATFVARVEDYPDRGGWDAALVAAIDEHRPGLVVSAGFLKLLGPRVLAAFPFRIVNTHPALLPAFPGTAAVRKALAYGVRVTGATVHLVDEGVDTGPIVDQVAVRVRADDDEASLHARIKDVEHGMLVEAVRGLAAGYSVTGRRVQPV